MKKFWFIFLLSIILLPASLLAENGIPSNDNPIGLGMFVDLTALAAGIVALTAFFKNLFNTSGMVTDIISWALGPVLGIVGWYFKLGMFADLLWYLALIYGLLAAFYANKGWDLFSIIQGKKDLQYNKVR